MTATPITTHRVDALARLLEQYKGKPKLEGLVGANADQVQELEDAFTGIANGRSIFDAIGAQLDRLGVIVDLERPYGMEDETYRLFLFAKIGQNVSGGEAEAIIAIAGLLTDGRIRLEEHFPAGFAIYSDGAVPAGLEGLVVTLIAAAKAGGVRLDYVVMTGDADNPFAFSSGGARIGGGFSDDLNPGTGGKFADVLT